MGYHWHTEGNDPAAPAPPMSCAIPFASGAEAKVTILVTGPDGITRVPTLEEWSSIIRALATNQFQLTA